MKLVVGHVLGGEPVGTRSLRGPVTRELNVLDECMSERMERAQETRRETSRVKQQNA